MDTKEINELAEIISNKVIIELDDRYTRKSVGEKHERILSGSNGDVGLPELVRNNAEQIKTTNKRVNQLYAGIASVIGIFIIEFIAWMWPKLVSFLATP